MVFYEISGMITGQKEKGVKVVETTVATTKKKPRKQEAEMFDHVGRIVSEYRGVVSDAVDTVSHSTKSLQERIDVVELRKDSFKFVLLTNFKAIEKQPITQSALTLLDEIGLIGAITKTNELTEKQYCSCLDKAERNDFCRDYRDVKNDYHLDNYSYGFGYKERAISQLSNENISDDESREESLVNHVKEIAERMSCINLEEEVGRLFANKRYGTPTHYIVKTDKRESATEIYDFLLGCLYKSGRIKREVVNIWSPLFLEKYHNYEITDIEKLFNKCEYGAIILKSEFAEWTGGNITDEYKKIIQICEVIKRFKKNTLIILCLQTKNKNQNESWLDNLDGMSFLEISERVMFKKDAERYLLFLAEKDKITEIDDLHRRVESDKGYCRDELRILYASWYIERDRAANFPEYNEIVVLEKKTDNKPEGRAYKHLCKMIGLEGVKKQIDDIIAFSKVQRMASDKGLKTSSVTMHMVFTGSPGTAKTTVARLFAQVMKDNDLLSSGKFVEAGRADLVDRYIGGTAPRVKDKFKEADGGVLFIDEAYSLVDGRNGLYGDEAINTIVQEMENRRESVIVIFAGYKKEMEGFIKQNSGLKSRVAHYIDFPDYDENELTQILELMADEQGLKLEEKKSDIVKIMKVAAQFDNFGNGRFVRNLLDKAKLRQAGRISNLNNPQIEDLQSLKSEDFELPDVYRKVAKKQLGFGD